MINRALTLTVVAVRLAIAAPLASQSPRGSFTVVEASIDDMRKALEQRRTTSREIVQQYLTRIAIYEDQLNAIITVNGRALAIADSMDRERARGRIRGPLHGIPIALKDNIHTTTMRTTGGALAFADVVPPYEATLARNLEAAGAIILAKTQLTELANWVASGMPANYNGLNGYGMNPWDPRRDPRESLFDGRPVLGTGGSSSGVGTNVSFWAANVGTETSGSILSPSNQNMLVGIKPTVGRVSRYGVIPITADQDTPGPMARTVSDAAIMLGAMEGTKPDPHDSATTRCPPPAGNDYTKFLDPSGLRGARIGVPRAFYYEKANAGSTTPRGGLNDSQKRAMDDAIAVLKAQGAVIVDPADIPSVTATDSAENFLNWSPCAGLDNAKGLDANCSIVFKYGMKRDFNAWLATLGNGVPVKTLTMLREWNIAHQRAGAIKYGQALLDISDEMNVQADRERYEADRRKDIRLSATNGLDAAMKANRLDALLFPGVSGASIAARPGYPTVTVPWAFVPVAQGQGPTAFPAGFEPRPQPFNVSFTGTACSEPKLIELAFAFEQATKKRLPPPLFP
ncbi:MAG: amidase [Gemmatimonadetes bacterium]|nr:MAG: amidase [Gemmatimonadota bacterium]HMC56217.1 amidase family protein [Gemmatimonadaceae bacterium]